MGPLERERQFGPNSIQPISSIPVPEETWFILEFFKGLEYGWATRE